MVFSQAEIPAWAAAVGFLITGILAAAAGFYAKLRKTRREDHAAETKDELDRRERAEELGREQDSYTVRHLRQLLRDREAERRADEAHCEGRIKSLLVEIKELRESERKLFARVSAQDQLIDILKERDTKMRHGLADQGIGVKSVEGPLIPKEDDADHQNPK